MLPHTHQVWLPSALTELDTRKNQFQCSSSATRGLQVHMKSVILTSLSRTYFYNWKCTSQFNDAKYLTQKDHGIFIISSSSVLVLFRGLWYKMNIPEQSALFRPRPTRQKQVQFKHHARHLRLFQRVLVQTECTSQTLPIPCPDTSEASSLLVLFLILQRVHRQTAPHHSPWQHVFQTVSTNSTATLLVSYPTLTLWVLFSPLHNSCPHNSLTSFHTPTLPQKSISSSFQRVWCRQSAPSLPTSSSASPPTPRGCWLSWRSTGA